MGNLINNYLQGNQTQFSTLRTMRNDRPTVSAPSVSSTADSFDRETDKLIKPLDGKGHLVDDSLINAPKEFARDTLYTTKALADGVRGKANDHQLGKLNDLGLKIGGVTIASYLMTRKSTPKTKLMEFVGFGAFLASMKLWPKVALEIPARLIHGFNYRKQYIDDQGRKKEVGLDPNYMPFDLYRGEKKSENLDVIGDRLGIKKDLVNRQEATKEQMRKISVQNNTLWMLTAGVATPVMTALACNEAEKVITPIAEKISNKKVNNSIDGVANYLDGRIAGADASQFEEKTLGINPNKETQTEKIVKSLKGKTLNSENINQLADTLADGFDADMKDAAKQDIKNIIGDKKYVANQESTKGLASKLHSVITAGDSKLATKISEKQVEEAVSQGTIRGAVRNMLTSVGVNVIDAIPKDASNSGRNDLLNAVSTNFKSKDVSGYDFFKKTPATESMSDVERLAHNIREIVIKVNNSNPSEDFIPQMSSLENMDKGIKSQIDKKLIAQSEEIAKQFYNGTLAIGDNRQEYISGAVSDLFKGNAPRTAQSKKIFHDLKSTLSNYFNDNKGYVITEDAAETITGAARSMNKFNAIDKVLTEGTHFKVEKANETLVANNWAEVSDTLFKELGITDKDLKLASKNKEVANKIFIEKLEKACSNPESYKKLITNLGNKMAQLDEKMDTPNAGGSESMMSKLESSIDKNCRRTGEELKDFNFTEMKKTLVSSEHGATGINIGSIMNAKKERLHSRINGVHGSYMRLLQTCEFFHRSNGYEKAIEELNADGANFSEIAKKMGVELPANNHKEFLNSKIAERFGMDADQEVSKEIIGRGKKLLLKAHTNQYYNKMGTMNNPNFFTKLMKSIFRPSNASEWDKGWSEATSETFDILNSGVKSSNGSTPKRVFEGSKGIGQKLQEHMNQSFNTLSSIVRKVYAGHEPLTIPGTGVAPKDGRASAIFDLVGKAPSEFFFDTAKQKFNTGKWMKTFKPILAATFIGTVAAQFLFGKKDADIKA